MLTIKKRTPKALAVITGILGMCLFGGCTPPGQKALIQGDRLLQQGKYQQAAQRFQRAVELLPGHAQAWNRLGLALHHSGQTEEAVHAYRMALEADRDLADARFNLGHVLLQTGDLPAAVDALSGFTVLDPENYQGWMKLGTAQMRLAGGLSGPERMRQLDAARKSLERALSLQGAPEALNALGVVHIQRGRPREALPLLQDALQKQPDYAPALLNVAVAHHQHLNDWEGALQVYQRYLALEPRPANWDEVDGLVRHLKQEAEERAAKERAERQRAEEERLARERAERERAEEERLAKERAAHQRAEQERLARERAAQEQAAQKKAEQERMAKERAAQERAEQERLEQEGLARQRAEEEQAAQQRAAQERAEQERLAAERAAQEPDVPARAEFEPTEPPAPADPAQVAATTDEPEAETGGLTRRLNPRNWFARSERPRPITPLGDQPAVDSGTPPPAWEPDEPLQPEPAPSVRVTTPAVPAVTPLPPKPALARHTYHAPLAPAPGNRQAAFEFFSEGMAAQRRREFSEAVAAYRQATQRDPAFFEAWYNLGLSAHEAGQVNTALFAYEYALALEPASFDARYNFALVLQQAGYARDAANELERLLKQYPDEPRAHLTLANVYAQQLFETEKARRHYQRVLALEPRHPQATAIRYWMAANP